MASKVQAKAPVLGLPAGSKLDEVSLILSKSTPIQAWRKALQAIGGIAGGVQFWLGDCLNFGEALYGEKYSQYIEETGLAQGTLNNYQSICGKVKPETRLKGLSFGHHEAVAKFDDPATQRRWLEKALQEGWTRQQLREAIKEATESKGTGPHTKRKLSVLIEFEEEPNEHGMERLRTGIEKGLDKFLGGIGKVRTWSLHR